MVAGSLHRVIARQREIKETIPREWLLLRKLREHRQSIMWILTHWKALQVTSSLPNCSVTHFPVGEDSKGHIDANIVASLKVLIRPVLTAMGETTPCLNRFGGFRWWTCRRTFAYCASPSRTRHGYEQGISCKFCIPFGQWWPKQITFPL